MPILDITTHVLKVKSVAEGGRINLPMECLAHSPFLFRGPLVAFPSLVSSSVIVVAKNWRQTSGKVTPGGDLFDDEVDEIVNVIKHSSGRVFLKKLTKIILPKDLMEHLRDEETVCTISSPNFVVISESGISVTSFMEEHAFYDGYF